MEKPTQTIEVKYSSTETGAAVTQLASNAAFALINLRTVPGTALSDAIHGAETIVAAVMHRMVKREALESVMAEFTRRVIGRVDDQIAAEKFEEAVNAWRRPLDTKRSN